MSTCKDCIHYGACKKTREDIFRLIRLIIQNFDITYDENGKAKFCECFKDRSKFIELPCRLGDKVFYFDKAGTIYKQTIFQFIYGGTGLKLDSDVMFDSRLIGSEFFLSYEEAEKALKERDKE